MAQFFRKNQVVHNRKVDFVEEVGVDIADAIDWLDDIKGPNANKKEPSQTCKIEKDHLESEKVKKVNKSRKISSKNTTNCLQELTTFKNPHHHLLRHRKISLTKINHEFVEHLQNELQNSPTPSALTLSHWLKNPSVAKNVLFIEHVTTGHTNGEAQKCQIQLTPQVLTIFKNKNQNRPNHIGRYIQIN